VGIAWSRVAHGWRRLGYASESQYCRERAGCSVASLRARMTLSRRASRLPSVAAALAKGVIGYEVACIVARVATPATADAWLARAADRTVRHLREEVEAVEMLARASGDAEVLEDGPPDDDRFEATRDIERKVLSGEVFQMSGGRLPPDAKTDDVCRSIRPGAGHTTVRLRVSEETYFLWKALEREFRRSRLRGSFVAFLAHNFIDTWGDQLRLHNPATRKVMLRDTFRCTSPVCGKRWVEDHHVVYLSHGGSNDLSNRTSLCPWCHHHGIHEGRLRAEPPAPNLTWHIGRDPILRVAGRTRVHC